MRDGGFDSVGSIGGLMGWGGAPPAAPPATQGGSPLGNVPTAPNPNPGLGGNQGGIIPGIGHDSGNRLGGQSATANTGGVSKQGAQGPNYGTPYNVPPDEVFNVSSGQNEGDLNTRGGAGQNHYAQGWDWGYNYGYPGALAIGAMSAPWEGLKAIGNAYPSFANAWNDTIGNTDIGRSQGLAIGPGTNSSTPNLTHTGQAYSGGLEGRDYYYAHMPTPNPSPSAPEGPMPGQPVPGLNTPFQGTPPNSGPQPEPEFGSDVYGTYVGGNPPPPGANAGNTDYFTPPNMGPQPEDRYPPYMGDPSIPPGNNMPTGRNYSDLVPNPGGDASNTGGTSAPYDFGPGSNVPAPYNPVLPDPRYDASQSGGAGPGVYDDPILANAYSNTSGAGTSQLNMNEAMSHPSYSQAYIDYLRSQGRA